MFYSYLFFHALVSNSLAVFLFLLDQQMGHTFDLPQETVLCVQIHTQLIFTFTTTLFSPTVKNHCFGVFQPSGLRRH